MRYQVVRDGFDRAAYWWEASDGYGLWGNHFASLGWVELGARVFSAIREGATR